LKVYLQFQIFVVVLINTSGFCFGVVAFGYCLLQDSGGCLTTEAVEGAALALESVHDVKSGDGLAASVLGVGDGVSDDVLKEDLEHAAGLLVDEARDALHTTTASETADSRLGDALDVVTKDLPVALGAALAETLSSFSATRHD
jgi:hypothetical protein